jgi:hypothetical protein
MRIDAMTPQEITLDAKILDIVARFTATEPVFRSYDQQAGECVLCNALFETLETMAGKYDLDPELLLKRVRQAATLPEPSEHSS